MSLALPSYSLVGVLNPTAGSRLWALSSWSVLAVIIWCMEFLNLSELGLLFLGFLCLCFRIFHFLWDSRGGVGVGGVLQFLSDR